jgi:hypothetical protein
MLHPVGNRLVKLFKPKAVSIFDDCLTLASSQPLNTRPVGQSAIDRGVPIDHACAWPSHAAAVLMTSVRHSMRTAARCDQCRRPASTAHQSSGVVPQMFEGVAVTEVCDAGVRKLLISLVVRKPRSLVTVAVADGERGALASVVAAGAPGTLIALACLVLSVATALIAVRDAAARPLTALTIGAAGSATRVSGAAVPGTGVVAVWIRI